MGGSRDAEAELNLPPGFRFHPTDDELVIHYLCRKAAHQHLPVPIIADVDLYKYNPWDLPEKALFGQREWYFFTPRDRKYPNGSRPNRAAGWGYWKATGADKPVSPAGSSRPVGIKKALVFYHGKAPKGVKTDWIMHEYRLADTNRAPNKRGSLRLDEWVLCRLYNKKNTREKMQRGDASFCVPTVSMEDNEETGSENIRTPESDVDHDTFTDLDDLGHPGAYPPRASEGMGTARPSGACGFQTVEQQKEDSDWFMGLNLDEWQSTLLAPPPLDMPSQDYYFPVLGSPQLRPSQTSVPPF